jgi:hypothetical protein
VKSSGVTSEEFYTAVDLTFLRVQKFSERERKVKLLFLHI